MAKEHSISYRHIWEDRVSQLEAKALADILVKAEFAILPKLEQAYCWDMLADRCNSKLSVIVHFEFARCVPEASVEYVGNLPFVSS
jgi:hypothetical protein